MTKQDQKQQQVLDGIVEEISDGVVLTNERGQVIEWNRAMEEMTGMRREDTQGRYYWDVLFELTPKNQRKTADYERTKTRIQALLRGENSSWLDRTFENRFLLPGGATQAVEFEPGTGEDRTRLPGRDDFSRCDPTKEC